MTNLNKMKKCELIEYCKELLKGADNKLLEENEKLKKELKEEIKIGNKLDLQVYRQDKVLGDYLAINSKLEEDIYELKNKNEILSKELCLSVDRGNKDIKTIIDLETENYNLKEETELLTNSRIELEIKYKKEIDKLKKFKKRT